MIFVEPPRAGAAGLGQPECWQLAFQQEFGTDPSIKHQAFAWASPGASPDTINQFKELGFDYEESAVLVARAVVPPARKAVVELRVEPIVSSAQWLQVAELLTAARDPSFGFISYYRYALGQVEFYASQHTGALWRGAYIGEDLCGFVGAVFGDGICRFQHVTTHPEFQRRGICRDLLYATATAVLVQSEGSVLVIIADPGYHALQIYESLGFRRAESIFTLECTG